MFTNHPPVVSRRPEPASFFKRHGMLEVAAWLLGFALILLALPGCFSAPPHLVELVKDSISANAGHMADPAVSPDGKAIATVNHDSLQVVRRILTGEKEDAEVLERRAARGEGAPR